jgi:hypothetical protein
VLWREEIETPGWTQLKLPGQAPSPRCGHSVTNAGHYVMTLAQSLFLLLVLLFFLDCFSLLLLKIDVCTVPTSACNRKIFII